MHVVELSNHPGDMLSDAERRRLAAGRRVLSAHEDELIRYHAQVQTIRVRRDRARAGRRWWSWLKLSLRVWTEKRRLPRSPVQAAGPATDLEEKIMAGIAGEQLVATELARALDDDWTLLRGYRNRRGEIDQLLLGPRGLFAIEVKNLNATVHVDGDRWRADKYDNYGNLVERRPVADRRGRSPSVQLNEPADDLERFLGQRGQLVEVQRVVVLTHRRSRLGAARNLTVRAVTSAGDLLSLAQASATRLTPAQRAEIESLVGRDHEFHGRRRRPGTRPPR